MKPEDVGKNFNVLLDLLIKWGKCVRYPIDTALTILAQVNDELEPFKAAASLWATSIIISTILQIPMYQFHGISWGNVGFHLSHQLMLFSALLSSSLSLYIGFRIFKLRPSFIDVFVINAVFAAAYQPLLTLLTYPTGVRLIGLLKYSKGSDLDWGTTIYMIRDFTFGEAASPYFGAYSMLSGLLLMVFSFGIYTLQLQILSTRWGVEKPRLFSAAAFSICFIGTFLGFPLAALSIFATYSFL